MGTPADSANGFLGDFRLGVMTSKHHLRTVTRADRVLSNYVRTRSTRTVVRDPEAIFSAIFLRRIRQASRPNRSLYGMAQRAIFCWHRLPFQPREISQAVRALQQCHHSCVSVQEESVSRLARRLLRTLCHAGS